VSQRTRKKPCLPKHGSQTSHKPKQSMGEIHFIVQESPEGGLIARVVGAAIFTESDDLSSLRDQVRSRKSSE